MIRTGIYPGTFDPITFGHIDIIRKSLKIVDALEFSNKVAGISTTKEGAANSMPSMNEVENY